MNNPFANKFGRKVRGVNLGGWLVLEKWMTPSVFEGRKAEDETRFCMELGAAKAKERLRRHWNEFITEEDFKWLANHGINAVRIPVGHWIFGPPYQEHDKYVEINHPYVEGGVEILDSAFDWAEKHGLFVVIDLHAAPGCQNGWDHGGIKGVMEWHKEEKFKRQSIDLLDRLAERYKQRPCLLAIEVLNEPRGDVRTKILKKFTREAYWKIREHCDPQEVAVVFHDGFRDFSKYIGFMKEPEYSNVILDIHRYQCFEKKDKNMDIHGHIQKATIDWKNEADDIIKHLGLWTYVGEWSLGLDPKFESLWKRGRLGHKMKKMDNFQKDVAYRAYGAAQLTAFEKYLGWFFWSYKHETSPHWSFRECVQRGWLPVPGEARG